MLHVRFRIFTSVCNAKLIFFPVILYLSNSRHITMIRIFNANMDP